MNTLKMKEFYRPNQGQCTDIQLSTHITYFTLSGLDCGYRNSDANSRSETIER
jgi:hypothetical protein